MSPFRFARISPPGESALGIVSIDGTGAAGVLADLFRPTSRHWTLERSGHGELWIADGVLDDVVVIPSGGGFWVSLHGNPRVLEVFESELAARGGERVASRELAARSLGEDLPRVRREALTALSEVRSLAVARWLLRQSDPEAAGLAGWLRQRAPRASAAEVLELVSRRWGLGLLEPPTVVLSGPPNAGKSTLFNRWVGHRRVVEHPAPGTTRDLIVEEIHLCGFPIRLVDGAGLRSSTDSVEQEGVRRMYRVLREADLVLQLIPPGGDPSLEIVGDDEVVDRALKIRSRFDQIATPDRDSGFPGVSGRTGEGLETVEDAILERLYGVTEIPSDPAPFTIRQCDLLRAILEKLEKGEDARAIWDHF